MNTVYVEAMSTSETTEYVVLLHVLRVTQITHYKMSFSIGMFSKLQCNDMYIYHTVLIRVAFRTEQLKKKLFTHLAWFTSFHRLLLAM